MRYGTPQEGYGKETIDPLDLYGIDDDPPRLNESKETLNRQEIVDVLSPSPFDEQGQRHLRLAGIHEYEATRLPPRLFYICRWFGRIIDQPASIWWAGGYVSLHSALLNQIEWYLDQSDKNISSEAKHLWTLLIHKFGNSPKSDHSQYHSIAKIKTRGWSALLRYEFEESIRPFIVSKRPFKANSAPPEGSWNELGSGAVVALEVKFPAQGIDELDVAPEQLYQHFRAVRDGLERGAALLKALEVRYWRTASFETDSRPGERYLSGSDRYLHWIRRLFDQLSIADPSRVRADFLLWPQDEEYFFDKLKLHAWAKSFFSGKEVGEGLLRLDEQSFWNGYNRRELLHLLRIRWNDLYSKTRGSSSRCKKAPSEYRSINARVVEP